MSHRSKTRRRRRHSPHQRSPRRPADPAPSGWKVLSIASAAIVVDGAWALWIIREYRIFRHLHCSVENPAIGSDGAGVAAFNRS